MSKVDWWKVVLFLEQSTSKGIAGINWPGGLGTWSIASTPRSYNYRERFSNGATCVTARSLVGTAQLWQLKHTTTLVRIDPSATLVNLVPTHHCPFVGLKTAQTRPWWCRPGVVLPSDEISNTTEPSLSWHLQVLGNSIGARELEEVAMETVLACNWCIDITFE